MLLLSKLEQGFFFATQRAKHGVVTIEDFKQLNLCSVGTLRVTVSRLVKKGALVKLKNGVYAWNVGGIAPDDAFYVAQQVFDGYVAFSSALYLYKLLDEFPFTVFIVTSGKSASRAFGQTELKAVALHNRALGMERVGDYWVSTLPKTLYDCFYLPVYSGGLNKVLWAVYQAQLNKKQWLEFLHFVDKFENSKWTARVGSLLALLNKTDRPVPAWVIKKLGRAKLKVVDERKLLSWWYA